MGIDTVIITGYGCVLEAYYAEKLDLVDNEHIAVFRDSENKNSDVFICLQETVQILFDRKTGGYGGFGARLPEQLYLDPSAYLAKVFRDYCVETLQKYTDELDELEDREESIFDEPGQCIFSYNH